MLMNFLCQIKFVTVSNIIYASKKQLKFTLSQYTEFERALNKCTHKQNAVHGVQFYTNKNMVVAFLVGT